MIIPTRKNKRGQFWMLQCDDMPPNVSWWQFFGFHTLSKAFTREIVLKLGKNCVLVIFHSVFVGREKIFYTLLAPNMCIHKLPYDHGFAQKHPKSVFNALIKFYSHKRDAMVNFWRWYFLRSILHDFTIKVTLRSSKIVFWWSSIMSLWAARKLFVWVADTKHVL